MRVVAIDGPSGSGKSTIARHLAERLGLRYLDTGAMYRAVAFAALRRGLDPSADADAVGVLAADLDISVEDGVCLVDGVDASVEIRGPEVSGVVSLVSAIPAVRSQMVRRQRSWIERNGGGVVEGRDIGAVVWPDAELKVYLTARLDVRAERRHKEVEALDYTHVEANLATRDALDSSREVSPLQQAPDALVVDTTDRSIDEVVDLLVGKLA